MQRLAAAPVSTFLTRCLHRVDGPRLRLSRGRLSVAGLLADLLIGLLETRGARSGQWGAVPVISDGRRLAPIASSTGRRRNPAWCYNRAHPEAHLTLAACRLRCRAEEAEGENRWNAGRWPRPCNPAFEVVLAGQHRGRIPVLVLAPTQASTGAPRGQQFVLGWRPSGPTIPGR